MVCNVLMATPFNADSKFPSLMNGFFFTSLYFYKFESFETYSCTEKRSILSFCIFEVYGSFLLFLRMVPTVKALLPGKRS